MHNNIELLKKIKNLPNLPGCYLFLNFKQQVIYVGKAKRLNMRVKSYLYQKNDIKTTQLLQVIHDFQYITCHNEQEALILEQNLIKKYQPQYNVLLLKSKNYPYIKITNSQHPQYKFVRQATALKEHYYGPFANRSATWEMLKLLQRNFPLHTCGKFYQQPCLYYHLQQCSGACFKVVDQSYYQAMIANVNKFFNGNMKNIKTKLTTIINSNIDSLQFEAASRNYYLLKKIDNFAIKQHVQFPDLLNRDFINFVIKDNIISIVTLFYRSGKLQAKDEVVTNSNFFNIEDIIRNYCQQLYAKNPVPNELYLPKTITGQDLKLLFTNVKLFQPIKGNKQQILKIVKSNALSALNNFNNQK